MSMARIIILALAAVAAIGAVFLARSFSTPRSAPQPAAAQQAEPAFETVQVLTAAADLPIGHRIASGDLQWTAWPKEAAHASFVSESNAPDALETFARAVARADIAAGEPITPRKLINPGDAGFMAAVLEPGKRAVAVRISAETGAGGFILPNDRVDVILTRSDEGGGDGGRSEGFTSATVLENIRVLAIDQTFKEVDDEQVVVGSTATLELAPAQAERLSLAEAQGEIALALRSVADIDYESPLLASERSRVSSSRVRVIRYGAQSSYSVEGN